MSEQQELVDTESEDIPQELLPLPQDWTYNQLSNLADVEMGSSPKSEHYNEDGEGLPFHQGNNEFGKRHPSVEVWCSSPVKTASAGSILMSVRAPVGDINITEQECCIGRGLAGIKAESINREYLFQHLQDRKKWLERISAGSTYDSVNSSQVKSLNIRVPPRPEQRNIASVLYNVDQAIRKHEDIIETAKRIRRGYLWHKITGEDVDGSRQKGRVGTKPVEIPESWDTKKVGEIATIVSGNSFPKKYQNGDDGPFPVVKVDDMNLPENNMYIEEVTNRVTQDVLDELSKNVHPAGTVIHPRVGEALLLNKTRITAEKSAFDDNIMGWVPEDIHPEYLYYVSTLIDFKAIAQTGTVPSINKTMAGSFRVPYPSRDVQKRIADEIAVMDEFIANHRVQKEHLERLKKGLMQDLLTGEVRTKDTDIEVLDEVKA